MAGTVIIPWYATGLRTKAFSAALEELAPTAMRYGASAYAVYRSQDDRYKFQQLAAFNDHVDWDAYWDGPEMRAFRARYSGWFQIPVLYSWWDDLASGGLAMATVGSAPTGAGETEVGAA